MRIRFGILVMFLLLAAALAAASEQAGTAASGRSESSGMQLQSIAGQLVTGSADGLVSGLLAREQLRNFLVGDADGNHAVNISDAVFLIAYIFAAGVMPYPYVAADVNCDGMVNISDSIWLINYIFSGGPPPTYCF